MPMSCLCFGALPSYRAEVQWQASMLCMSLVFALSELAKETLYCPTCDTTGGGGHLHDACAGVAGIALASNLGGMTSPISSPQNIFAIQEMGRGGNSVSWLSWFAVALPIAFIGNLVCWGVLLAVYRPMKTLKEVRRLPDTEVSLKLTLLASAPGALCQSLRQSFQSCAVVPHCHVKVYALLKASHACTGSNQLEAGLRDGDQPGHGGAVVRQLSTGQVPGADGHCCHHPHGLLLRLWPSEQGTHTAVSHLSARFQIASAVPTSLGLLGFEAALQDAWQA